MNEISTRTAKISLDENGILHFKMTKGIHLDYEDAIDNAIVIKKLTDNRPTLKLVDARSDWTIDKKAQKFIRSNEVKERTIARAVLKSSVLSTILSNFFSKLNKPKVPTQIFTDYSEAYKWLLEMKEA
ncbi:MAG TPA: hypothetical protein VNX01_07145 [Bacteroidia bacterium]|jgi:hypothetical protein|nr:hypothetical protein [Bacteroidia bacterium]